MKMLRALALSAALVVSCSANVALSAQGPAIEPAKATVTAAGPPSLNGAVEENGVLVVHEIPYCLGIKQCVGDLYLPPDYEKQPAKIFPVVMVVHGGAWMLGSKLDPGEVDVSRRLAKDGYVVFNINYRLVQDGGTYPNSMNDAFDALAFLAKYADRLRIDCNRLGMFGGSAGSEMSLLLAYAPGGDSPFKAPEYPGVQLPKAKVAVTYGTVSDLRPLEYTWVIHYMDDTPWHSPELYAQASPISYVKTAVPTLCVHADHDNTVPIEQSKTLVAALKSAGIKTDFLLIQKSRHVFHESPGPKRELAFSHLKQFMDGILKNEAPEASSKPAD